ncbi:hypothetical protein LEP1GSC199_3472 [Leptospira vanthielii serovar Holland str. Waz Holland = ATCC 700522]|uniref:Uncharacterized protein n=1 Tax=Leptospira vanthielii serovar Holland str. Waz Holland = ATCC 700522 TaxID=1218591 RepID=N1W941_9LEPT|nr:hypothetical protein LEP1GSC199_3472 [Leptospira vanthielii serovar Holland str. Waz Holland = ATCC 700522]
MYKLFLAFFLFSIVNCKTTFYQWNLNGRTYVPINPTFEDEYWKIIIHEINETEELDNTNKYLKIKFSYQNKSKKYRILKLMKTSYDEFNFKYMKGNNLEGIADVHNKNPDLIDFEHLYRKAGVMVKLKSKLKDRPERFERFYKNNNSDFVVFSCDGTNSGNDARSPGSGSEWLPPGKVGEEYIRCPIPQGMQLVSIFSDGDFEIPIQDRISYHPDVVKSYGEYIK